jgi:serine/threonine protein kinase
VADEVRQGTLISGKYRIERSLAGGGMGNVYLATHLGLGSQVALKMLRRDASDKEVRARFQREGVLAAQLDSDHVVRVTDLGWANPETPYLVMELLEGRDLQDEISERKALPVAEAVDLLLQASAGVAAAHGAGLVHRDLKPANLFLAKRKGRASVVKVLDFGLSKALRHGVLDSLTHETARFGTPVYMSPEQIRSSKNVDARADQYALAAVLYQCLTGRLPFESEALTQLFVLVATQEPRPPSSIVRGVPSKLDRAVLRGLAKEAEDRFADVVGFAEAIAPFGSARAPVLLEEVRAAMSNGPRPITEIESADTEDSSVIRAARSADDAMATPQLGTSSSEPSPRRAHGSDDQLRTLIKIPREEQTSAHDDPQIGLTSSMNAMNQTRRRFAVASLAGGLSVLGVFLLVRALLPSSPPVDITQATAPAVAPRGPDVRTPPEPRSPAAPSVTAAGDAPAPSAISSDPPPPSAAPADSPTVAHPRADATGARKPFGPKAAAHPAKSGEKSVLDVFGER